MKKLFTTFLFLAIICFSQKLNAQDPTRPGMASLKETQLQNAEMYKHANLSYAITPSQNNTWGYNILVDQKLMISQPSIPAIQGNQGFKTVSDAESVAKLVIEKLKSGNVPPSVTIEELKKLSVIK
jgi:hypothetical protein